ncbi:hypothetical protein AGMMS50239_26890 [Bacteroidia bacterium]|nr:hypothetical protein AGMMS50239_26890 [Bacteroidia bacterium]GHV31786.1 hypothetical protein FACS1894177_07010 [Bacteroidia bacterium]
MRKLTKKSLDELAKTMSMIDESEQDTYWGKYDNDCFWRCVSYMESGGISFSESAAESYALSYFGNVYSNYPGTASILEANGAGMSISDIQNYLTSRVTSGNYSIASGSIEGQYIGFFNTNNISNYSNTGSNHAVIVLSTNADNSLNIFDPQLNTHMTIAASQASNVSYVMY